MAVRSVILVFMVTVCDTVGISLGNKKATSECRWLMVQWIWGHQGIMTDLFGGLSSQRGSGQGSKGTKTMG